MKRTILFLSVLLSCGQAAFAFAFSAVAPNGQTLYYDISGSNTVTVVALFGTGWGGSAAAEAGKPTGNLVIPDSVTYEGTTYIVRAIGDYAFTNCWGLTSVTIPSTVISIGSEAFKYTNGLTSVTIPNSVTSIGAYAFMGNPNLTSVTIGNSVISIGNGAFYNCSGITSVVFNADSCISAGAYVNNRAFVNCTNITSFTFGSNVKVIPDNLCYGMTELSSPIILNNVTHIGQNAFENCSGLTSVTLGNSVTSIGKFSFENCSGLTSIAIPNSVTYIGDGAFYNCSGLTSVTISNSVTSIAVSAFGNCSGLTSVTIPNSVTSIEIAAFSQCSGLTSVTIPNSVTSIGNGAFSDCIGLTSVAFNADSCISAGNSIAQRAFAGCTNITSFTIGSNVRYIPAYLCYGMAGLTSITIPASVENVYSKVFSGCSTLQEITFLNPTPPSFSADALVETPSDMVVNIPCEGWSQYSVQLPYINNFMAQMFEFVTESEDETKGTVQILTEPSCTNLTAVLSAVPSNGYRFDHWSTGSTDNPYTLTVTSDTTIIAYFVSNAPATYTVTVLVDNPAAGSVNGGGEYEDGTSATITAYPADGYHFDHWSTGSTENPYTLTVTSDTTIVAYFVSNGGTEGIGEVEASDIRISVSGGRVCVEGITTEEVRVYDITGRMVQNHSLPSGVYIVKVGTLPAQKVVVMR